MVNEGDSVGDSCSGQEILKVGDVLLESVVGDAIRISEGLLGKFGEFKVGGGLGIRGKKVELKFSTNLLKVFSVEEMAVLAILLYVPQLREGNSLAFAHSHDHCFLCGIDRRVDMEVHSHSFHPAHCIGWFSREVSKECCFEFRDMGEHQGRYWWYCGCL